MFIIAGATGHTGSVVAETLLARRQPVSVLVRTAAKGAHWTAKGATAIVTSLDEHRTLAEAMAGAEGVYLLVPPHYQAVDYLSDRRALIDALAHAVRDSKVRHVVLLSSVGAHHREGTGLIRVLHEAEAQLSAAADNVTIVRAPYFMENWLPALQEARMRGVLPSFLSAERAIPMIATRDIGHLAAECLLDKPKGHRVLELSGPALYSPADVARIAAELFHRPVRVERLSLHAVVPMLTQAGFSESAARLAEEMYAGLESGHIDFEDNGCCRPRGLITLAQALFEAVRAFEPAAGIVHP